MSRSPWMALIWLSSLAVCCRAWAQSRPAAAETRPALAVAENAPSAAAAGDPWASPEVAAPRLDNELIPRPHAARSGTKAAAGVKSGFKGLIRTSASLAGVVGLIVLLAWGYRAAAGAGGRLRLRGCEPGLVQVLGRTSLGPRQALCLVRVGPQLVLVGATRDSLRALTVVRDADLAARLAGQRNRPADQRAVFETCLETESKAYNEPAPDTDPSRDALAHLGSVKHRLSQTLRRMEKLAAAGA